MNDKPDCTGLATSDWVLQKVKDFRHYVWLSCEGFEEELMALFTAIEASRYQKDLASNSEPVNRGIKKLKRLSCFINYDFKGGSSS